MMEQIAVSMILPIYNMESYLADIFSCIEQQTCQDFEVILVNDGSKDDSLQMCQEFAQKREHVIIVDQPNGGLSAARNAGMRRANGKYLAWIDPDDKIDASYVEVLLHHAEKHQADIMSCCTMIQKENECYKNSFWKQAGKESVLIQQDRAITQILSNKYYRDADDGIDIGVAWGKLYRADFVKKNHLKYKEGYNGHEDGEFNLKAFALTDRIYYIDQALYSYRYYNGEESRKVDVLGEEQTYLRHMKMIQSFADRTHLTPGTPMCIAYQLRFLEFLFCTYRYSFFAKGSTESNADKWKRFHMFHKKKIVVQNLKAIQAKEVATFLDRKENIQLRLLKYHFIPLVYLMRVVRQ